MASKHVPDMPDSFKRFTSAVQHDDDASEFFTASGTYQGHHTAPAHKAIAAGGLHQTPGNVSDEEAD